MSHKISLACAGAFAAAAILAGIGPASAHTSHRPTEFFPPQLAIDDPGTNDELALPTFAYTYNADWARKATTGTSSTEKGSPLISKFPSTARSCIRSIPA